MPPTRPCSASAFSPSFHRGLGPDFDGFPEAAWIVARDMHGKGYAGEAAAAAHRWFDATCREGCGDRHERTVCLIDPRNAPSLKVAERLGNWPFEPRCYKDVSVIVLERTGLAPGLLNSAAPSA